MTRVEFDKYENPLPIHKLLKLHYYPTDLLNTFQRITIASMKESIRMNDLHQS